jgi:glutathione S-transferase
MPSSPHAELTLYTFPLSGHAHRVELFLSLLGLQAKLVHVELRKGEQRLPDFLRLNLLGQVPVLVDGEQVVADSNAILVYLAVKYGAASWLPADAAGAAAVQRFLSIAAGEVYRGPASARLAKLFGVPLNWEDAKATAENLFAVLEQHLAGRDYLAAAHPTIADVACYSYIAHAPEGGLMLDTYPLLRAWLARVEALPGFAAMRPLAQAA